MANTSPLKFKRSFTIRVDQEFLDAIDRIRRLSAGEEKSYPIPTSSEVVRNAVLNELTAFEAQARRKK